MIHSKKHSNILKITLVLKALLNRPNISSSVTKMPCWMKCWIGLTEWKNSKTKKKSCCMKKNRVGWKFNREQIFHPTFSGLSNTIFMLDRFIPLFIQYFILMRSFRMLELRISNDSTKLKRSANCNNKKMTRIESKWA